MTPDELRARLAAATEPVEAPPASFGWLKTNIARRRRIALGTYLGVAATGLAAVAVTAAVALPRHETAPVTNGTPTATTPEAPDATASPRPAGSAHTEADLTGLLLDACDGRGQNALPQENWRRLFHPRKWSVARQGPLELKLFDQTGGAPGLPVRATVTDPAGGTSTASGTVGPRTDASVTLRYPRDFPGADTSRAGIYRVAWETADGRPLACESAYLSVLNPAGPRSGRAALGDVDGDGVQDLVELVVLNPAKPGQWLLHADMSALGDQQVTVDGCCIQRPMRLIGVVDLDDDGYGEIVLEPTTNAVALAEHIVGHLKNGTLALDQFVVMGGGTRYGWGCADVTPKHPGRELVVSAVEDLPGKHAGALQAAAYRNGQLQVVAQADDEWQPGEPAPGRYWAGFRCGTLTS
jgi:hypothetical protein